jgi:hypothetical protein
MKSASIEELTLAEGGQYGNSAVWGWENERPRFEFLVAYTA